MREGSGCFIEGPHIDLSRKRQTSSRAWPGSPLLRSESCYQAALQFVALSAESAAILRISCVLMGDNQPMPASKSALSCYQISLVIHLNRTNIALVLAMTHLYI